MKKIVLIISYIAILIHFLKDITQDILRINSPLDLFGNIQENLSFLPSFLQKVYLYGFGGLSLIAEIVLLLFIPKIIFKKASEMDFLFVKHSFLYLVLFIVLCVTLDPGINPILHQTTK